MDENEDDGFNVIVSDVIEEMEPDSLGKKEPTKEIRKLFWDKYLSILDTLYSINDAPTHRKITKELDTAIEKKKNWKNALGGVMHKYKYNFDYLMNTEDESE